VGALILAGACGGGSQPASQSAQQSPTAAPAARVDEATAGNVTGRVVLEGTAPRNEPIKMNSDPVCMREVKGAQAQETFMVGEGGALQNVFVYVKEGLGDRTFDTPSEAVVLDQQGCRYHPHVFSMRVGQPLQVLNSDPTLHNIHAIPKNNQEFNTGQPIKGMKFEHTFTAKEVMVPFKCDVHGWMNAYAGVLDHPYSAVTGTTGAFELKTLPPGNYVIEAWHEKLGTQTQQVTIGEKETKDITFTFKLT
jgi:plastocyanin